MENTKDTTAPALPGAAVPGATVPGAAVPFQSWDHPSPTVRLLISDVYKGLDVLRTHGLAFAADGGRLSDAVLMDRARNVVAGLVGNYSFAVLS